MITEEWGARVALVVLVLLFVWWYIVRLRTIKKWYIPDNLPQMEPNFFKLSKKRKLRIPKHHHRNVQDNVESQTFSGKKKYKSEGQCRQILEKIFKKPFPSVRPHFLTSPKTRKPLELDCYNSELKLALEYNGPQHYTYTPHFHRSKLNFISQVHRDDWKRKKCKELGIKLIEVPYWIVGPKLEPFITRELQKLGY